MSTPVAQPQKELWVKVGMRVAIRTSPTSNYEGGWYAATVREVQDMFLPHYFTVTVVWDGDLGEEEETIVDPDITKLGDEPQEAGVHVGLTILDTGGFDDCRFVKSFIADNTGFLSYSRTSEGELQRVLSPLYGPPPTPGQSSLWLIYYHDHNVGMIPDYPHAIAGCYTTKESALAALELPTDGQLPMMKNKVESSRKPLPVDKHGCMNGKFCCKEYPISVW